MQTPDIAKPYRVTVALGSFLFSIPILCQNLVPKQNIIVKQLVERTSTRHER